MSLMMKFDTIIKNGLVILENDSLEVDIGITDGKIAAIGQVLGHLGEIIDAEGLVVSPGMVDAHVHITEPGGGYRDDWEGYESGTRASAKGGVTTFIEMPLNQVPATIDQQSLPLKFLQTGSVLNQSIYRGVLY